MHLLEVEPVDFGSGASNIKVARRAVVEQIATKLGHAHFLVATVLRVELHVSSVCKQRASKKTQNT